MEIFNARIEHSVFENYYHAQFPARTQAAATAAEMAQMPVEARARAALASSPSPLPAPVVCSEPLLVLLALLVLVALL